MRLFFLTSILFFIVSSNLLAEDSVFDSVEYVRNYDGDTIVVNLKDVPSVFGDNLPVRLAGIDTAEINSKDDCEAQSAKESRDLVEFLLMFSQNINLKNIERDKYFRVVAKVYVDGLDLSDFLLKRRLAVPYDGGTKKTIDWCVLK